MVYLLEMVIFHGYVANNQRTRRILHFQNPNHDGEEHLKHLDLFQHGSN